MRPRWYALPILFLLAAIAAAAAAQPQAASRTDSGPLPSIEEKTAGLKKLDGYFPLYWNDRTGQLWMEVSRFGTEVLHSTGFGAGLGSNDIGIDRGALSGSRIVVFERVGPKVLLVAPNLQFRAVGASAAETRAVKDAFARSVLWGFQAAAESPGRVLVDATEFLVRDATIATHSQEVDGCARAGSLSPFSSCSLQSRLPPHNLRQPAGPTPARCPPSKRRPPA